MSLPIAALGLVFVTFMVSACMGESENLVLSTEFDVYEEPLYGYRISYPTDWQMRRVYFDSEFRNTHRVSVDFVPDSRDIELQVVVHKFLPFYDLGCKSNVWVQVASVRACEDSGTFGGRVDWDGGRKFYTSYTFVHDEIQYSIGASSSSKAKLNRYLKTVMKMVDSFTLATRTP